MQLLQKTYTPAEYLELEEKAEFRSEYRDGEIVPMAGETTNHNLIAGNIYAHLRYGLKGQGYRVYIGNVRLWISRDRQYTYPDVMVVEGEHLYTDKSNTTVMNPRLIVEVLSKSTGDYDRGDKFNYRRSSIPELQDHIFIHQSRHHVMQYVITKEGPWLLTDYTQAEDIIKINLGFIEISMTLNEIYDRVNFEEIEE
jgi:Uma2 family endonuclease